MHEAGHPKLVPCDNLEGKGGEGGRSNIQDWGHMYIYGQFMLMYSKNITIL